MAAQEPRPIRYCEKCFAVVAADMDYCSECGAAVQSVSFSEGSDTEIYPELARANLLRMRGDYKQAEEVSLAILRRFPNNVTANFLLGDICAERGDLDQAIQWHELGLDLQPDSVGGLRKLQDVRQRKADHEAATTAKLLGLPTTKPKGVFVAAALLTFIGCIGVAAFYLGRGYVGQSSKLKPTVEAPVDVPDTSPTEAGTDSPAAPVDTPVQPASPAKPKEDRDLMTLLADKAPDGARVIDASQDPRSKDVMLTFWVQTGEDERPPGARLAASALSALSDASKVTLRAVRSGRIVMIADVAKSDLVRATSQEFQDAHKDDPDAWIDEVLTNIWRPAAQN